MQLVRPRSLSLALIAALSLIMTFTAEAAAAPSHPSCTLEVRDPQYNATYQSVVFEGHITCTRLMGTTEPAEVRVEGWLASWPGTAEQRFVGPVRDRPTVRLNKTMLVATTNLQWLFYVPDPDGKKLTGSAWYDGAAKITVTESGATTSASTNSVFVATP